MASARGFRMRLIIISVILCLCGMAIWPATPLLYRYSQQIAAVNQVEQLHGLAWPPDRPKIVSRICFTETYQITDKDVTELVPRLKHLPNLKWLEIQSTQLTDASVAHICEIPSLETLIISGVPISDESIPHLRKLTNLKCLMFVGDELTDDACATIAELQRLETLGLSSPAITDAGIVKLTKLPRLRQLNVGGTQVTPSGLSQLSSKLRRPLAVFDDTSVNPTVYTVSTPSMQE